MSEPASAGDRVARKIPRPLFYIGCLILLVVCCPSFCIGPGGPGLKRAVESGSLQKVHQIGVALFYYSTDHHQQYPDGQSSTEVFQKLLDGKYVTDPAIFHVRYDGKVPANAGQKLKPENVCFDVTTGADSSSPDSLPLVFLTGYKVTYAPGVSPVPLFRIFPDGLCVFYKGNNAIFLKDQPASDLSATFAVRHFIPDNFQSDGHTYRQLTPDGITP